MEKLKELQTTVHLQSDRICQLEKQNRNLEKRIATDLRSRENKQDERISILEKQYSRLEERLVKQSRDILADKNLKRTTKKKISVLQSRQNVQEKLYRDLKNQLRNLMHLQEEKSSFLKTFTQNQDNLIRKELLVNNNAVGSTYLDSANTVSSVTGTVVVHVDQGDDVLLRTLDLYNGAKFLYLPVNGHVGETTDTNTDLKAVMEKLEELQTTIHLQNDRISLLEEKNRNLEKRIATDLHNRENKQDERISILEKQYSRLEERLEKQSKTVLAEKKLKETTMKKMAMFLSRQNVQEKLYMGLKNRVQNLIHLQEEKFSFPKAQHQKSLIRKERVLAPVTYSASLGNVVAFYAYLSKDVPSPSAHHILTFDYVITNAGNAYHPHSGTFIVPRSGFYVFTWTIRMYGTSQHPTELLVNNYSVGAIYLNSGNAIDGCVTGTVVVHVNQGDDVLLRTYDSWNGGDIVSRPEGRSSFAGWALA
ncbi:uncharacterized protein LOC134253183 [Saccostrea cucullata]|uniref:uncharacterized protein LOC134253183 n=1 Tax=Saccostrea cuccullata TaxID=36930 RepID=UPI002ED33ADF